MADGLSDEDGMYLDLKGARERLCRAQVHMFPNHRGEADRAIRIIDRLGVFYATAQWSRFDDPEPPAHEQTGENE